MVLLFRGSPLVLHWCSVGISVCSAGGGVHSYTNCCVVNLESVWLIRIIILIGSTATRILGVGEGRGEEEQRGKRGIYNKCYCNSYNVE